MNILVHSKNLPVTDSIRTFIGKSVKKVVKLSGRVTEINVFLDTVKTSRGTAQEAEAKVRIIVPGKSILVKSRAHDLYLAISQAMADASRHLRKRKERYLTKRSMQRNRSHSYSQHHRLALR